jgi:hypothetical protein
MGVNCLPAAHSLLSTQRIDPFLNIVALPPQDGQRKMVQAAHNVVALMGQNVSFFSNPQRNQSSLRAVARRTIHRYANILPTDIHLGSITSGASWGTAVEQRNSTKGVTNTVRSLQPLGSIPSYLAQIEALTFADRLPRARPLTTGHGLVEIANKQKIELSSGFLISPFRFRFNI